MKKSKRIQAIVLTIAMLLSCVFVGTTSVEAKEVERSSTFVANSTTYFIPATSFNFTGSNTGNRFYIPKACTTRIMLGIKRMDGGTGGTVTVSLVKDGQVKHSITVPADGTVGVYELGWTPAGESNLRYEGQNNVRYGVTVSLYTWEY